MKCKTVNCSNLCCCCWRTTNGRCLQNALPNIPTMLKVLLYQNIQHTQQATISRRSWKVKLPQLTRLLVIVINEARDLYATRWTHVSPRAHRQMVIALHIRTVVWVCRRVVHRNPSPWVGGTTMCVFAASHDSRHWLTTVHSWDGRIHHMMRVCMRVCGSLLSHVPSRCMVWSRSVVTLRYVQGNAYRWVRVAVGVGVGIWSAILARVTVRRSCGTECSRVRAEVACAHHRSRTSALSVCFVGCICCYTIKAESSDASCRRLGT